MTIGEAILTCLRKHATFSGRVSKGEFWLFYLFVIVVGFGLSGIHSAIRGGSVEGPLSGVLPGVWSAATILPLYAARWRRLHDIGLPGWYALSPLIIVSLSLVAAIAMGLVSGLQTLQSLWSIEAVLRSSGTLAIGLLLGAIVYLILLILLASGSVVGTNSYGPDPLEERL